MPSQVGMSVPQQVWAAATSSQNEQETVSCIRNLLAESVQESVQKIVNPLKEEINDLKTKVSNLEVQVSGLSLTKEAAKKALDHAKVTVFFGPNSTSLKKECMNKVRDVAEWLQDYPSGKILLKGYADRWATKSSAVKTAEERAKAVSTRILSNIKESEKENVKKRIIIITQANKNDFNQTYEVYKPPRGCDSFSIKAGDRNRRVAIKYLI